MESFRLNSPLALETRVPARVPVADSTVRGAHDVLDDTT